MKITSSLKLGLVALSAALLPALPIQGQVIPGHAQLLWYDASRGTSVQNTWGNAFIMEWQDQSGNAHTAWGGLASLPYPLIYEPNGINGLPSAHFQVDGGAGSLVIDPFSPFRLPSSFSVFAVVDLDSNGQQSLLSTSNGNILDNVLPGVGWIGDTAAVISMVYQDGTASYYRNGELVNSIVLTIPDGDLWLGGIWQAGGLLSEIVIYNGPLDSAEQASVNSYLGGRYGIEVEVVPEPTALALLGGGFLLAAFYSHRAREGRYTMKQSGDLH